MISSHRHRDPVEVLAEQFLAELRAGHSVTIEDYTARHGELAPRIRLLFPTLVELEHLHLPQTNIAPRRPPGMDRLGDYRLVREIGRGGMGVVYEAVQESLGRTVALKVLSPILLNSPHQIERFLRESRAAARLHHSHIIPVFGCGHDDGTYYYIMQYIDGVGLDQVVAHPGPFNRDSRVGRWKSTAESVAKIASALQYAHDRGILHRDIKPANLILDGRGQLWIADFGLAKANEYEPLTASGDAVGTLRYMAPEQLDGRSDERTDVFGLGLTLYELLLGKPAYDERDCGSLLQRVAQANPQSPRRVDTSIPSDLETIVLKAVARDPAARYPSAGALADDLRRFTQGAPLAARRTTTVQKAWRWSQQNRAVAILGSTTLALSLAMTLVTWLALARTNVELSRESKQRRQALVQQQAANDQRARAESNLQLALVEFDSIIAALANESRWDAVSVVADDSQPVAAAVPRDVARILDRVLRFYDRFVDQNGEHPEMKRQLILAHRRAGDIHHRLANYDAAMSAYERAVALNNEAEPSAAVVLERAALRAEMGAVRAAKGEMHRAHDAYHDSSQTLLSHLHDYPYSQRARFELARVHQRRAELFEIEGQGRQHRHETDRAIGLLHELVTTDADNPEYQFYLACAYVAGHPSRCYSVEHHRQDRVEAIRLLAALVENYPQEKKYRYQLSEAYACASLRPPSGRHTENERERLEAWKTQLKQAVSLSRGLVQQSPSVPDYVGLHGRNLARLATVYEALGEIDEAETHFRRAVSRHQAIAKRFPNVPKYQREWSNSNRLLDEFQARKQLPSADWQVVR